MDKLLDFIRFFQAEDGIRDWSVTGVQTCALPISACLAQSDGDGIPDDWKVNGVTVTWPDSHTKHIDLAGLGVQRGRKAVIVWVDWMEGAGHTHRPTASGDKYPVQ